MAFTDIKEVRAVSSAALQLLTRDVGLAGTFWRDPADTDFAHKVNETVSLYLPAYLTANKRALRANANRVQSSPQERKVDISLQNDLQVDIALTDENMSLDIRGFSESISAPAVGAIVRGYDEEAAATMANASPEVSIEWDSDEPYDSIVDAFVALNDHNVPATGRFLVLGSTKIADLLKADLLKQVNTSGSDQTLRNGVVGQVANFDVMTSPFVDADFGMAYHRTAFALCSRAPVVPQGVAWGQTVQSNGLAIRVMQHLSQNGSGDLQNMAYFDSWIGTNVVKDAGTLSDGKFTPSVTPDSEGADELFVRAVSLGGTASS